MFPIIEVFGHEVGMYAVLAVLGAGALGLFFLFQCRSPREGQPKINFQDAVFMLIFALLGAVIGAKLLYFITSADVQWLPEQGFFENIGNMLRTLVEGGLVFYGGLIGALLGGVAYVLLFKAPVSNMIDMGFVGVPLFHAFGRVGCFMAGCCYGMEYHGPLSVVFPANNAGGAPAGVELFPVQLVEACLNLVLWAMLTVVYRRSTRRWLPSGLYLVSYGVIRFVLEFFRGDLIRGSIFSVSSSQFISFFIVAAGILLLINPKWLDKFGGMNDEKYLEQEEKLKKRAEERRKAKP